MRRPLPRDHFRKPLLQSPFHPRLAALMQAEDWYNWGGYVSARTIRDAEQEYFAIRNAASLFDLTPMVKYRIAGPEAGAFLDRLTVRDVSRLAVGRVHYTCWCDDDGHVLDDGTLFRLAPTAFRLCCQERHLNWLLDSAIGFEVEIAEETEQVAALALQGPTSRALLTRAGFDGIETLKPFQIRDIHLDEGRVTVSRTGFTGDLGYELFAEPEAALALWDRLWAAGQWHGLQAIGFEALDLARLEAGFIIANIDFITAETAIRVDRRRTPDEIGLGWLVDEKKAAYWTGKRAILAQRRDRSARWCLVGLDIDGNVPADHAIVYHKGKVEAGQISAAAWSPSAKRNIALASLRRPYGDTVKGELWVEIYALRELVYHKLMVRARVVERPFYDPPRRRVTPPAET